MVSAVLCVTRTSGKLRRSTHSSPPSTRRGRVHETTHSWGVPSKKEATTRCAVRATSSTSDARTVRMANMRRTGEHSSTTSCPTWRSWHTSSSEMRRG
eukprot:2631130-Prymnesium_polylepis.1